MTHDDKNVLKFSQTNVDKDSAAKRSSQMNKEQLVRYVQLTEQIKQLTEELDLLKGDIKSEFPFGGIAEVGGIQYGTDNRTRVGYDFTRLIRDLGTELVSRYETKTQYLVTIVKLTSKLVSSDKENL